jgi:16S rRNA (adenine1518-N6/adenine1519-N6)-dimethyltransferase
VTKPASSSPTPAPLSLPTLLRQYNLRPKKGLGQNFLVDTTALEKILASAGIQAADTVLEIGPGLGSLTRYLALAARQVVAVELDERLFPVLEDVLKPYPNVRLVQGDILEIAPAELVDSTGYLVVANIPYYITSALLRHLLESQPAPRRLVLTVQREVAARICAKPGQMSLLALSVQVYGQVEVTTRIPAGAFYPSPKVDSAVVRLDLYPEPRLPRPDLEHFFRLIKAGFSQKRKTLRNALSAGLRLTPAEAQGLLQAAGIQPQRRAESLDFDEWGQLVRAYTQTK